jgi:hypothetical protein
MHKKSFVKRLFIGMAVMGVVLSAFHASLWPCSVTTQCPNGKTIWCQTFGDCGNNEQCYSSDEGYVTCICGQGTYIIVKCNLDIKTPRDPRG